MSEESEDQKQEAEVAEKATENPAAAPAAKKAKKKWPIVVAIVAVVIIVAGIGFWTWHEQPSFCNAICHTPMDTYVESYDAQPNSTATDKWGNEVSNSSAMLSVTHKEAGLNCLSCHVPSISQQVGEVGMEITGNYYYPLEERSLEDLVVNAGGDASKADSFCLNSNCHNMTRSDLTEMTSDMDFNPHRWQHGEIACSECHKSHRASVFYCTQCHTDATASMPDGWVSYSEGKQIAKSALS